jgi:tRNA pseudouridine38-40 synthase
MRNIKITLAYDGSTFHGWQWQPGVPTVQGAIVEVAQQVVQEKIYVHGASRTDSGVHALGQVANFKTQSPLSAAEFQRAFNALLPPAIRVVATEEVGPDFHARWQAQAKTYRYRIFRGQVVPPFEWKYVYHYPWPLNEDAMGEAARVFEGEHDFTSFAASSGSEEDDRDRDTVRVIYRSELLCCAHRVLAAGGCSPARQGEDDQGASAVTKDELVYVVRGKSFLRYMVRKIVGTLLEVGKGKLSPSDIFRLFELRDRSCSGATVPPEGLYLVSLEYPDPTASLATRAKPSLGTRS